MAISTTFYDEKSLKLTKFSNDGLLYNCFWLAFDSKLEMIISRERYRSRYIDKVWIECPFQFISFLVGAESGFNQNIFGMVCCSEFCTSNTKWKPFASTLTAFN